MSGVVCVVCPFADEEKLKNIHVDLALLVWGPALLSTQLLYPFKPIPLPLSFSPFFSSPPFSSHLSLFFTPFLFVLSLFFLSFLSWPPLLFGSFYLIFFLHFLLFVFCVFVHVCVSCMYVRACLAIPCVSANDNVKHTKSNIGYDNEINKIK